MSGRHLPPGWQERLVAVLGGHFDPEKGRFLNAWAQAEGGNATWNPANTTLPLPGASDYNSDGVKNYTRATWGVCATALTLTGPAAGALYYPKLLAHLQSAAGAYTAEQIVADCDTDIRRWGTDPALIKRILHTT